MSALIYRDSDGQLHCDKAIVITCGCGSVVPDARRAITAARVPWVPMISSSGNPIAKEYLHQVGLDDIIPSLRKNKHAVIYNERTGLFIDMYKAPLNQEYYDNIRQVANC